MSRTSLSNTQLGTWTCWAASRASSHGESIPRGPTGPLLHTTIPRGELFPSQGSWLPSRSLFPCRTWLSYDPLQGGGRMSWEMVQNSAVGKLYHSFGKWGSRFISPCPETLEFARGFPVDAYI